MKLMHIRDEGETIQYGFNFYPLSSVNSVGFILRTANTLYRFRFSKITKKIIISKQGVRNE
jgi:hypothetical protein